MKPVTFLPFPLALSASSSSSFLIQFLKRSHFSSSPLISFLPTSYSNTISSVSRSHMDKHYSQGKEDADQTREACSKGSCDVFPTKGLSDSKEDADQTREACSKGSCDVFPTKGLSDSIIPHILNLYASCATPRDFEIYDPNASFEDPLMCAHGVKQIKSAFYSLSKVFSESKIVEYSVKENWTSPGKGEMVIDNKQHYKFLGKNIDMISLIKLYVEEGKVVRHEDWWDKKPLWNRETVNLPLAGRIMEMTRRGSMLATHAMMGFGKDPTL